MPQKTMMWKGVALVEVRDADLSPPLSENDDPCERCYFSGETCSTTSLHALAARRVFGWDCEMHQVVYQPAQPTASDAEWVDARLADLLKEIASECGVCEEDFPYGYVRAALLDAIKRGRGE